MALEQMVLAVFTGVGFGAIVHIMGSSWQRLAVMLVMLWLFQTGAQQLWRVIEFGLSWDELIFVSELRLVFSVFAVLTLGLLNRLRLMNPLGGPR